MFELDELSLLRRLQNQPDRKPLFDCVDDERLGAYLDGALAELAQGEMETHLACCRYCLDRFLAAHAALADDNAAPVPSPLLSLAMALVVPAKPAENIFTIAVELVRDTLNLIATTGSAFLPMPAAQIRGREPAPESAMLQIDGALGGLKVGVEIERLEGDLCQVVVSATTADGALAEGLRVSLISGERERASYLARQGAATFDRIPPGDYRLAVTESGNLLGAVELTIKEERRER